MSNTMSNTMCINVVERYKYKSANWDNVSVLVAKQMHELFQMAQRLNIEYHECHHAGDKAF